MVEKKEYMGRVETFVLSLTSASHVVSSEVIQALWSNYGEIRRFYLSNKSSVVAKIIDTSSVKAHPKGWSTEESHARKIRSYEVEEAWYKNWSMRCSLESRLPELLGIQEVAGKRVFVLEDLNSAGYTLRKNQLTDHEFMNCIKWLANFHGQFITDSPEGLWKQGTYWHLSTRTKEWEAMPDSVLKRNAQLISDQLDSAVHQTIIHGDAKVANFCFSNQGEVSAVDFQYVGGGCGMKDLVYFLGSCLSSDVCFAQEERILSFYFDALEQAIQKHKKNVNFKALEEEWRQLYTFAWTDFTRFLTGWMPGHHKLNDYADKQIDNTLINL